MGGGTAKISASGTVILINQQSRVTIQHDLGVVPQIAKIWCDEEDNTAIGTYSQTAIYLKEATATTSRFRSTDNGKISTSTSGPEKNDETKTVFLNTSSTRPWMAGIEYHWEVYGGIK